MNLSETVALLRFVAAACPAQKLDEYTPDAWAEVLADIAPADAKTAVINLVREKPFIACSDVVTGVKALRSKRLQAFGDIGTAPPEILDDTRAWVEWERERREGIASGRITHENDTHPKELQSGGLRFGGDGHGWWNN